MLLKRVSVWAKLFELILEITLALVWVEYHLEFPRNLDLRREPWSFHRKEGMLWPRLWYENGGHRYQKLMDVIYGCPLLLLLPFILPICIIYHQERKGRGRERGGTRRKVGDEHQDEAASGGPILNFWFGELLSNHEHCKIWSQVQQCKVQTKYNDQVQTTEAPRSTTASRQMPVGRSLLLVWGTTGKKRKRERRGRGG